MKEKTIKKRAGFTQGPWISEDCTPGESTGLCYAIKSEHTIVARTTDGWKEARANARLIASAPELYGQCKLFERVLVELQMQGETGVDEQLAQLREILAKVDGGEG
tara:strand:+ start:396 stop:713 length:318 start_codon:yes stop_codon:yes gene_type:complete